MISKCYGNKLGFFGVFFWFCFVMVFFINLSGLRCKDGDHRLYKCISLYNLTDDDDGGGCGKTPCIYT